MVKSSSIAPSVLTLLFALSLPDHSTAAPYGSGSSSTTGLSKIAALCDDDYEPVDLPKQVQETAWGKVTQIIRENSTAEVGGAALCRDIELYRRINSEHAIEDEGGSANIRGDKLVDMFKEMGQHRLTRGILTGIYSAALDSQTSVIILSESCHHIPGDVDYSIWDEPLIYVGIVFGVCVLSVPITITTAIAQKKSKERGGYVQWLKDSVKWEQVTKKMGGAVYELVELAQRKEDEE